MWTDDARDRYRTTARTHPSSMSDGEWAVLEPYFPPPEATAAHGLWRGKAMVHPMRRVLDGIFYVLRNGVTWRALPMDFPPWKTVYGWFRRFSREGLFEHLNAALVARDRTESGRGAQPTAAVMDSQTVKATEAPAPAPRASDGGKKITGLKRHALVDVDGRLLLMGFSEANVHDSVAGAALLKAAKTQCPFLELTWAHSAYQGPVVAGAATPGRVEVVTGPRNQHLCLWSRMNGLPEAIFLHEGVGEDDQFAHDRRQSDFGWLTYLPQPRIEQLQIGVGPDRRHGSHVEDGP